ncbi:MAG: glycosyltransferase family 4 protein [Anaerolineae bacterium]|nr:glycosyltransferase family 4 protein [Anaerolineae bacterium]
MRVLQVVEATTAGVKTHVLSLVRHLDRRRFDLAVACPPVRLPAYGDVSFVSEVQQAGVPVIPIPVRRALHPASDLAAAWRLAKVLRREAFDLVHLHSSKAGLIGRLAVVLSRRRVPVIYTPNAFAFQGRHGLSRRFYAAAERFLGRWTSALVCVSPGERDVALAALLVPPARLVLIENAAATRAARTPEEIAAARQSLALPPDAPVVGSVGRLSAQKGHRYLIEAAPVILARVPQARLVLVGDGELRPTLEQQAASLGLAGRVLFAGYRPHAAALIPAFDCLALPSLWEGLSFVLLDALAAGVPAVVTRIPGTEMIADGETALIVPPCDAGALAAAIARLLTDQALAARLGEAGRALVVSRYDLAQQVRKVEQLYEMVTS